MASPSSTKSDDKILINPKLVNKDAKSPPNWVMRLIDELSVMTDRTNVHVSNPRAKIQKVQPYLVEREEFAKYYSPKLLSVGPIHHERGKNYKLLWAEMYLTEGNGTRDTASLLGRIKVKMNEIKKFYSYDAIEGLGDDELGWMFLLDGCAVLHFMNKASVERLEQLQIKLDQLVIVYHDLLLLENQLPYQLLKLLCNDDEVVLMGYINNFLNMHHLMSPDHKIKLPRRMNATEGGSEEAIITVDHPTHLLDFLRTAILNGRTQEKGQLVRDWTTYRNIQELQLAWIEVVENKWLGLTDIRFTHRGFYCKGELQLSSLKVDKYTATTFLNLIAYEMCPDFENQYEISSYVCFLDSLIHHPKDVKKLKKAGVLRNTLGSDEEVFKLFKTIATDLTPNDDIYALDHPWCACCISSTWSHLYSDLVHRFSP